MTERTAADEEIMRAATADDDDTADLEGIQDASLGKKDDTLELGGKEAPELTDEQKAEEEEKQTRSRHPSQRIAHYRAVAGTAERERDAALQELATLRGTSQAPVAEKAPDPYAKNDDGSDKYEFGEADPVFLKDTARFEVRESLREEREAAAKVDEQTAATSEIVGRLNTGIAGIEKAGPEKYDDFEAKINEAIEARGGEPLHPIVSIGIAVSPAGADIAYRLATDEAASAKIEKLAQSNPQQAAIAFGELEGQYLESEDDDDLDPRDPLDMARMLGRERARRKGLNKPTTVKLTKAPAAQEKQARGTGGQFEVADDAECTIENGGFAAYERKIMGKKG